MKLCNPTGKGIRSDKQGDGHFGASRGNRTHQGLDFLCEPGQIVRAAISGKLSRSRPYHNDTEYVGCGIWGKKYMVKMWYFTPYEDLIHDQVKAGQEIGLAQDISQKYGGSMLPHIHLGLWSLEPTTLLNPEKYIIMITDKQIEKLKKGGF